jgi:uncharacterized cupredoxin-like copper-binding protein
MRAPEPTRGRRRLLVAGLAGLVLAVLLGAGLARGDDGPRTVVLTLRHSRFEPAALRARAGETVTFVVRNLDPIDHELIVGDQAVQRRHEAGRERHHHGEVPGEVSVPAGTERRTTYRFAPGGPGRVEFACHLPGHYAYGMRGWVRVAG